jgi:TetR/AcrR family transcriptional repressor of lmrAB and yxaGH operons
MILAASRLFQRGGYEATSWRTLVAEAGAPWGSIHHHFPGGKEELGVAAIVTGADAVDALIAHCFDAEGSPSDAIARWFRISSGLLAGSGYAEGCPVATVALETVHRSQPMREASREAFARWERTVSRHLRRAGARPAAARQAATAILALLEGALMLARVRESAAPMTIAASQAKLIAAQATAGGEAPSP